MDVQIFGIKNDADTRKALRFFSERRRRVHFVDFKVRAPSRGELRRFAQKFGIEAIVDRGSKKLIARGLERALYGQDRWLEILEEEPRMLVMPLGRYGKELTVGLAPDVWEGWTSSGG